MRIQIWSSVEQKTPNSGPYKMLDIVEEVLPYAVGDVTHYGEVIEILPPIPPFNDDSDQSIVVKLDAESLITRAEKSVLEKPPSYYNKIEFFPIHVSALGSL